MEERAFDGLKAQGDGWLADYDAAQVAPPAGNGAVGRVGGSDDESFARPDGAEARGLVAGTNEEAVPDTGEDADDERAGRDEPLDQTHAPGRGDPSGQADGAPITTEPYGSEG